MFLMEKNNKLFNHNIKSKLKNDKSKIISFRNYSRYKRFVIYLLKF